MILVVTFPCKYCGVLHFCIFYSFGMRVCAADSYHTQPFGQVTLTLLTSPGVDEMKPSTSIYA